MWTNIKVCTVRRVILRTETEPVLQEQYVCSLSESEDIVMKYILRES